MVSFWDVSVKVLRASASIGRKHSESGKLSKKGVFARLIQTLRTGHREWAAKARHHKYRLRPIIEIMYRLCIL
jgi:hypothetical protein